MSNPTPDRDEWPDYEWQTRDGVCDVCDEPRPVQSRYDPFMDEVHNERRHKRNWCRECWRRRKDDV